MTITLDKVSSEAEEPLVEFISELTGFIQDLYDSDEIQNIKITGN